MRKASIVLGTLIIAWLAGGSPARADYDYAWCLQEGGYGYPGECSYRTREQCLQSVSGRKGYCAQNPAYAVTRLPPQATLRGRHHPSYQ